MELSCEQIETLMNFYLDGELSSNLKIAFESHISKCQKCAHKYQTFKSIITDLRDSYKKFSKVSSGNSVVAETTENDLDTNISAYVDNELTSSDNIKIKKLIISKPAIRKKIEKIYSLKKILKESFEKNNLKHDYSKIILREITNPKATSDNNYITFTALSFVFLCVVWVIMLISALSV